MKKMGPLGRNKAENRDSTWRISTNEWPLLSGHNLSQELRLRLVRCYVFSVLLYGMEAWTETTTNKVQAFEMWVYRRILRISWLDKVTNDEVLRRIKKNTELINTTKIRKLPYFGHIMRNPKYQFLELVIQGKIAGPREKKNILAEEFAAMVREYFTGVISCRCQ